MVSAAGRDRDGAGDGDRPPGPRGPVAGSWFAERLPSTPAQWLLVVQLVAVLVPVVVGALSIVLGDWRPGGDVALTALRVGDVGGADTPLLGAWSRWGWAHPGPLLFWALAPFEWALGNDGLVVGVAAIVAASAVGSVLLARRRGGLLLSGLVSVGLVVTMASMGVEGLLEPWNPYVAFFPFVLFLLLAWDVVSGRPGLLPLASAIGTFCVQAHIGYLPLVGGLGALMVVATLAPIVAGRLAARRDTEVGASEPTGRSEPGGAPDPSDISPAGDVGVGVTTVERTRQATRRRDRSGLRAVGASIVVLVVCWSPALVQQLVGEPANITAIIDYSLDPSDDVAGWGSAVRVTNHQLAFPAPWAGVEERDGFSFSRETRVPWLPAVLAGLGVMAAAAVRGRRRDEAAWAAVAITAIALGTLSTARLTGFVAPYMIRWWWAISMFATLGLTWAVIGALLRRSARRADDRRELAVAAVASTVAVVAAVVFVSGNEGQLPQHALSVALDEVAEPTQQRLDPERSYAVRSIDPLNWFAAGPGLFLLLEQAGFDVSVEPDEFAQLQYGDDRIRELGAADRVLNMVSIDAMDAGLTFEGTELARWDPLEPAERAEMVELDRQIRAALGDQAPEGVFTIDNRGTFDMARAAGVPESVIERFMELRERGQGFIVYEVLEP